MSSWFDTTSSSISGFLSQAQKSIDKVLDIPVEDVSENTTARKETTLSKTTLSTSKEKTTINKTSKDDNTSSNSWLTGDDSFWGTFVTPKQDNKNKEQETKKESKPSLKDSDKSHEKKDKPKSKLNTNKKRKTSAKSKEKLKADETVTSEELTKESNVEDAKNVEKPPEVSGISLSQELLSVTSKVVNDDVCLSAAQQSDVECVEEAVLLGEDLNARKKNTSVKGCSDGNEVGIECSNKAVCSLSNLKETEQQTNVETLLEGDKANVENEQRQNSEDCSNEQTPFLNSLKEQNQHCSVERLPEEQQTSEGLHETSNLEETNKAELLDNEETLASDVVEIVHLQSNVEDLFVREDMVPQDGVEKCGVQNEFKDDSFVSSQPPLANSTPYEKLKPESNHTSKNSCKNLLENFDTKECEINAKEMSVEVVDEANNEHLKKENAKLCEIISVRESKLVELSKENLSLQETNAILRSQLEQLEQVHKVEDAEFENMKTEFTNRISDVENKFHIAAKERDLYKKQLEETQQCLSSDMENQLKEFQVLSQQKDEQIVQLMEEGEKLSKEVLQRSNNLKKLRTKEKEASEENESLKTRLKETETEIERLTNILKERDDYKKEQDEAIKKLNAFIKKQEAQLDKQKLELEESSTKLPSLQTALDNAYKEITELNKVNAARSTEVQEATLSVEMSAKEELRINMEKMKKESRRDCDILAIEITDLQNQLSRVEQQAARREDNLKQEITDLHLRLQEAETRNQELSETASVATRPLLRQIENLQHSYACQQSSWEKLEKNLTDRLTEAQTQQAMSQEKERNATEKLLDLKARVASLDSQNVNYKQEKSRLEAELEMERTRSEELAGYKIRESGKIEALKAMYTKQLESAQVEKSLLEQQLVVEKNRLESEQRRITKLEDQLKENKYKSDIDDQLETDDDTFIPSITSRKTSSSSQISWSESRNMMVNGSSTAIMEELRATIRHKTGEISTMKNAITTLEEGRESLTKELTTLISTNEKLSEENTKLARLEQLHQELQTKYNALLQMYGEKQEETEELKLDLQDIKIMYKTQIQELLSGR